MTECLRTYDALELWRDAEEVIRKEVVRKFIKKVRFIVIILSSFTDPVTQTVYSDSLAAPHSPIIPHTPLPTHQIPSMLTALPSSLPLRTPYTPFTAFVLKPSQLSGPSGFSSESPYARLLRDDDYPLTRLFNQMLRFVERDLCRIMQLAGKVSIKSLRGIDANQAQDVQVNAKGFHILANVVWDEFAQAIIEELGNTVFSVGRPNEFRKVR